MGTFASNSQIYQCAVKGEMPTFRKLASFRKINVPKGLLFNTFFISLENKLI